MKLWLAMLAASAVHVITYVPVLRQIDYSPVLWYDYSPVLWYVVLMPMEGMAIVLLIWLLLHVPPTPRLGFEDLSSCCKIPITLIDQAAIWYSLAVAVRKNLFRFLSWANSPITQLFPRAGRLPERSAAVPASERIGGLYPLPTGSFRRVTRLWQPAAGSGKHRAVRRRSYST